MSMSMTNKEMTLDMHTRRVTGFSIRNAWFRASVAG